MAGFRVSVSSNLCGARAGSIRSSAALAAVSPVCILDSRPHSGTRHQRSALGEHHVENTASAGDFALATVNDDGPYCNCIWRRRALTEYHRWIRLKLRLERHRNWHQRPAGLRSKRSPQRPRLLRDGMKVLVWIYLKDATSVTERVSKFKARRLARAEPCVSIWAQRRLRKLLILIGCPPGIRTPICCSRGSCPTIERGGNKHIKLTCSRADPGCGRTPEAQSQLVHHKSNPRPGQTRTRH
jgi:hypothetical protein